MKLEKTDLPERVRAAFKKYSGVGEIKMFGGLCFTLKGNMCCGTLKEDLLVRTGPEFYEEALRRPHSRPMNFTGKVMKGFVFVCTEGVTSQKSLQKWVDLAARFVLTLPPKKKPKQKPT